MASITNFGRARLLPAVVIVAAALLVTRAGASESARAERFVHPDGSDYVAIALRPTAVVAEAGARQVLILFDTSAGQAGAYREKALQVLKGLLAGLSAEDRVQLAAVDMRMSPLTAGFVPVGSAPLDEAMKKLDKRVPLGTTDLDAALNGVLTAADDASAPISVVYFGRGTSRANLITPDRLEELAGRLAEKRASFNSFVVGANPDAALLGALASKTGGTVLLESSDVDAAAETQVLLNAVRAAVFWPSAVQVPPQVELFPAKMPPLRSDRDTVLAGKLKSPVSRVEIAVKAAGPRGETDLNWTVDLPSSDPKNAFLAQVVNEAAKDGGRFWPLTDYASLVRWRSGSIAAAGGAVQLAEQAIARGDLDGAERILAGVLASDPAMARAAELKQLIAKRRAEGGAVVGQVIPIQPQPSAEAAADLTIIAPDEGRFATSVMEENRLITQMLKTDVQTSVNRARTEMGTNPEGVIQELKLLLERVRRAADVNPDVRNQLVNNIEAVLREASQRAAEFEKLQRQRDERMAKAKEMELLNAQIVQKDNKIRNLMERFNALMEEGRYLEAESDAAMVARDLAPQEPAVLAAMLHSRALGAYAEAMRLREARQRGVLATLMEVERSHIPIPDEPPMVYPAAEVWRDLTARRREKYSSMDLQKRNAAEKRIEEALRSPTQIEFVETPLSDVVDYLRDYHKIEIQLDKKALGDVNIGTDTPVTKTLRGISLKSALRLMLRELQLTYIIQDEVLLITTPEEAEARLVTKVYPVADLVLPIRPLDMSGMFGGFGGGGLGSMGMGGMGMGMGGMGMGGMGGFGGMGRGMGMGMGGMGGGFFNVPPGILPRVPPGGFQAFAVDDDLSIVAPATPAGAAVVPATVDRATGKTADNNAASTADAKSKTPDSKIDLSLISEGETAESWDRYFASRDPTDAAIRAAVRELMNSRKYEQVIAAIEAALRHGRIQPWMYEALVLAMQAADRPKEDIERAVMSAVDFAETPWDMLMIALHLNQLGMESRALKIYQDVAKVLPLMPEPYVYGLRTAKRLGDIKAVQWATLGILSQAWPAEHAGIFKEGVLAAKAALESLKSNNPAEAAAYEKALNEAIRRDVVVRVSWTGQADLDLIVEDPTGSVCTPRNPRSLGGGMLLGDSTVQLGEQAPEGRSEIYVCPQGFSGTYRVLVRRIWGKPTAGKVNVEVITHFRSPEGRRVQKPVTLENDEAVVVFDLENGRRKEPIEQVAMVQAAAAQAAVSQQVLGQQLAASVDPRAMAALAQSRGTMTPATGGESPSWAPFPFYNQGAVGYQPVIIWIPEGTNLGATAVVSADRRYVRITCVPFFSAIREVNIFNMATGENTQGRGGTGGSGFSDFGGGFGGGGFGGGGGFF